MTPAPLTAGQRQLVADNVAVAFWHSNRLRKAAPRYRRLDREVVDAAAMFGLCEAATTWEPSKGSFSGWVLFAVRKQLQEEFRLLRAVTPPFQYASRDGNISERTKHLASMACRPLSLDAPDPLGTSSSPYGNHDDDTRGRRLPDHRQGMPEDCPDLHWRDLMGSLRRLDPRSRRIIDRYYHDGFNDEDIAAELGVSVQRVSQLRRRALARLRAAKGVVA